MNSYTIIKYFTLIGIFISQSLYSQTFQSKKTNSQVFGSKLVKTDSKTGVIHFIQLKDDITITENKQADWLKKALSASKNHDFREISRSIDKLMVTHIKYQLYFKNIPVEGAIYNFHSKSEKTIMANGEYYVGNNISCTPSLKESEAFKVAVSFVNARKYRWENMQTDRPQGSLVIVPMNDNYILSYKYDIYALLPLSRQYIYIDANSGKVIKTLDRIHEQNSVGTAETLYNGTVNITTEYYSGQYRLRETGRGNGIETYNLNKRIDLSSVTDFTDDDNYWNTTANYDHAAYNIHYAAELTYDYYFQKFGRNSYDNNGSVIKNYVHYGQGFSNAFWDGQSIYYGDGSEGVDRPYASIDIVAHEITHGVTEKSAGLEYFLESGALNESFSDIFGIEVDFFKNPNNANYMIGEDIFLSNQPFRDMSNPNKNANPDTYKGRFWDMEQEVHCNSGVQNFWYYLLCEGGEGTNDIGDSYQVEAIGREKAAQIAFRNLTVYLTPNSDYEDARFYSIQSAKDLFGECSQEASSVANAWYAVGIGDANDCYSPENFNANQISSTQIKLNWKKNHDDNNVIITCSTSKNMGDPDDGLVYPVGSSIPGSGIVIYSGNDTTYTHTGLNKGTRYYYKAWSVKAGNSYSGGVRTTVIPPAIDAGEDQSITLPLKSDINLSGLFSNDFPPDSIRFEWKKIRGKEGVHFENVNSFNTTASFDSTGVYTLQLAMNCFGFSVKDTMNAYVGLTDSIAGINFSGFHNWIGMDIRDSTVFLADLSYGLRIIDVSDVKNPVQISDYNKYNVKHVHVKGDYAYLSQNFNGGLTILNIKDKNKPVFISYFDIPNSIENCDFVIKDSIVYFCSISEGLILIDVSDPYNPVEIGKWDYSPRSIALSDHYLYLENRTGNDQTMIPVILDISDPTAPRELKKDIKEYTLYSIPIYIQGEYLYKVSSSASNVFSNPFKFDIYNISDRENPVLVGSTGSYLNNSCLYVQGNYAYLSNGLQIIDVSDKSNPKTVSMDKILQGQVIARNDILFSALSSFSVHKTYLDNLPPYIYAGLDLKIDSVNSSLLGEIYDEGLPENSAIIATWSKISGPGNVLFSDIHSLNPNISFSESGSYVLRLEATDGELSSFDDIVCDVSIDAVVKSVPDLAKTITGESNVCLGTNATYSIPKIAGASYYIWTLPFGSTCTTTTNSITVYFDKPVISGNIQVKGINVCGEGSESTFNVTVNDLPAAPEISLQEGVLQSNAQVGNQWYFENKIIDGAVSNTYIPTQSGDYYAMVFVNGCSSQNSNTISFISTGTDEFESSDGISIYPNPTENRIKISVNKKFNTEYTVEIYNNVGALVETLVKNESEIYFELDLGKFPVGVYMVHAFSSDKGHLCKVIRK